jgi:hypothetical protein
MRYVYCDKINTVSFQILHTITRSKANWMVIQGDTTQTGTFEMRSGSHVQLAALRNRDLEDVIFGD